MIFLKVDSSRLSDSQEKCSHRKLVLWCEIGSLAKAEISDDHLNSSRSQFQGSGGLPADQKVGRLVPRHSPQVTEEHMDSVHFPPIENKDMNDQVMPEISPNSAYTWLWLMHMLPIIKNNVPGALCPSPESSIEQVVVYSPK